MAIVATATTVSCPRCGTPGHVDSTGVLWLNRDCCVPMLFDRIAALEADKAALRGKVDAMEERLRRLEQRHEDGVVKRGVPAKEWLRMSLDRKVGR